MTHLALCATTLAALSSVGCRQSNDDTRQFELNVTDKRAQLVTGYAWAIAGRPSPSNNAGHGVATVYLDTNENGRLDIFSEPSTWCTRGTPWSCQLEKETLTVHRVNEWRDEGKESIESSFVYFERYDTGWTARPFERLCDDRGHCAEEIARAYADSAVPLRRLNACQHDWAEPLEVTVGDTTVEVREPDLVEVTASLSASADGGVTVTAGLNLEMERVLVWIAEMNEDHTQRRALWTSEDDPKTFRHHGPKRLVVEIPGSAVAGCKGRCSVGVQAASRSRIGSTVYLAEGRAIMGVPR